MPWRCHCGATLNGPRTRDAHEPSGAVEPAPGQPNVTHHSFLGGGHKSLAVRSVGEGFVQLGNLGITECFGDDGVNHIAVLDPLGTDHHARGHRMSSAHR